MARSLNRFGSDVPAFRDGASLGTPGQLPGQQNKTKNIPPAGAPSVGRPKGPQNAKVNTKPRKRRAG